MKLDHLCDVSIERSAGGFGTLHSLTPDDGMRTGPISLHTAIVFILLTTLVAWRQTYPLHSLFLGERSGVAHDTINKLELGQRPARLATIRKLADALSVEPRELMKGEHDG
jgi:DNA-binding Xre family transcriptional regulator